MSIDLDGKVVRGVDLRNTAFANCWKDLPSNVQEEARDVIRSLLFMNLAQAPKKLHLHPLINRKAPSVFDAAKKVAVWLLHITADDNYKASFTYENGMLFFRTCGKHDDVDKRP